MSLLTRTLFSLGFRRREVNSDLSDEVAFHVDMLTEDYVVKGLSRREARQAALRDFGSAEQAKEEYRDGRGIPFLENWAREFRVAFRTLLRQPGLSCFVIGSLALGIGANTALFSIVDHVLLRPLPVANAARLVALHEARGGQFLNSNPVRLQDWQQLRSFEYVAGYYGEGLVLTGHGPAHLVQVLRTFGDWQAVLGVKAARGRGFSRQELQGEKVALLSDHFWRTEFSGDSNAAEQGMTLGSKAYSVVGVLPATANFPADIDIWTPAATEVQASPRQSGFLNVAAVLRPGVSFQAAQAEVDYAASLMRLNHPATDKDLHATISPAREDEVRDSRGPLLLMQGAVAGVLLIAFVNIASLLVARALTRRREATIRIALGSGFGGLLRTYLAETLLLSTVGGVFGLLLSNWAVTLFTLTLPADLPRLSDVSSYPAADWRVAAFACALSLLIALGLGMICAWDSRRSAIWNGLQAGGGRGGTAAGGWLQSGLVISQVALSCMLLVVAGMLVNSFRTLRQVPLGFEAANVLTFHIGFPWDTPASKLRSFRRTTLDRLRTIPGVLEIAIADRLPLLGGSQSGSVQIRGAQMPPLLETRQSGMRAVEGPFFHALRMPLQRGSFLPDRPTPGIHYTVVNQSFARTYFPGVEPIGQQISIDPKNHGWFEVVGVVGDVRATAAKPATPEFFISLDQVYWPLFDVVIKTQTAGSASLATAIRSTMQTANPNLVVPAVEPLETMLAATASDKKSNAMLVGVFAATALFLATLGLYGTVMAETARRTREIGIRMALGEGVPGIVRRITLRGVTLALCGLPVGFVGAIALSGLLRKFLAGSGAVEASAFIAAAVCMLLASSLASLIPARRAARIDPLIALRHE